MKLTQDPEIKWNISQFISMKLTDMHPMLRVERLGELGNHACQLIHIINIIFSMIFWNTLQFWVLVGLPALTRADLHVKTDI